MWDMHQAYIL